MVTRESSAGEYPDHLSDSDALMWRIESDPVLRSPITVVGLLDRPPTWSRLEKSLARVVESIPRLRQRIRDGAPGTRPRWEDDPNFSMDFHLSRVRSAVPDGLDSVLAQTAPEVMRSFDPARPLWHLTVIEGLRRGESDAAMVLRFHHTIADGVGAVALAEQIFDQNRRGTKPRPKTSDDDIAVAEHDNNGPLAAVGSVVSAAVKAGTNPLGSVRSGVAMACSVTKMLAPAREPLSPVMRGRSLDRTLNVLELPIEQLRDASRVAGGTINDTLLAAVAGAMRSYHQAHNVSIRAVRVTMPISVRRSSDRPGGNHFTPARFVFPVDDPDLVQRIRLADANTSSWRDEPALGMTPVLAWALDRLPTPVVQRAFASMLRSIDVDVVDVPGLRHPAYLAGARVERLWAFAPPAGAAMSVTLLSHVDRACIAVALDNAAVRDPDLMQSCLREAFDEVLALANQSTSSEEK